MSPASHVTPWRLVAMSVGPPCLVGLATMWLGLAPLALPLTNLAALLAGLAVAALWAGRLDSLTSTRLGLGAGLALIAATFLFASMDGVHRWWHLGPLRVNASALCSPFITVAIVQLWRQQRWTAAAAAVGAIQALHALQPDAGQATALALALAAAALALLGQPPRHERALAMGLTTAAASAAATLTWYRKDPLLPLPFVEQIVGVAFSQGWWLGGMSVCSLVVLTLGPWWIARRWRAEGILVETYALAGYHAGALLAAALGAFPVPVLGHGASPVLGAAIATGLLGHRAMVSQGHK